MAVDDLLLPLIADRNLLKLTVPDDNRVPVAGSDSGAELLAPGGFKVPFGRDQDVGGGVQPQELCCGLLGQMVGYDHDGLTAQAQVLALHSGGDHLECLARANFVCQ